MRIPSSQHPRSGFILADILLGLMLLAALSTIIAVSLNMRHRSAMNLSRQRAALQTAQQVLLSLTTTAPAPAIEAGTSITISRTGPGVGAMEWVQVTVIHEGRRAQLSGLAPPTTRPGGAP